MAARKGRGNTTVTFNSTAITNYCNKAGLKAAVDRIETTHFGSTAGETIAGDTTYSIPLAGDWDVALSSVLAPEVITTGTKRTAVIAFVGSTQTETWTWTSNAEVQDYSIDSGAGDKITWSATLSLSGAPTRTVA